jgi:hypothetical protein
VLVTLARACCCGSTCQNPTGSTSISATRHVEAEIPTAPFTGKWDVEWYVQFSLQFSGTTLSTALSSIRVRFDEDRALTFPDGTPAVTDRKKIDVTMTPAGGTIACNGAGSGVCGECGGTTVHRYDPDVSLPYYSGGTQVGALTLNSYVNTSTSDWIGVALQFSESALSASTGSTACQQFGVDYYGWDGSAWLQPSSSTVINPLRVYSDLSGGGPDSICNPIDQVLGVFGSTSPLAYGVRGATAYGLAGVFPDRCVRNLCPGGKRYLEAKGWTFVTDTATASIT